MNTNQQFEEAVSACRRVFADKLGDYGPSWRMMRPQSVTDQIFIKARRIRSLEIKRVSAVGEGILPEFMAIVNYSIIGVIQLENGFADSYDITAAEALALYDNVAARALELMKAKNHDYDEAWRMMRVPSYTDLILTKLERIKEIEDNDGRVAVSEGIESNYLDILVYAVFGVIKLTE